jgi:hypothetical protein
MSAGKIATSFASYLRKCAVIAGSAYCVHNTYCDPPN